MISNKQKAISKKPYKIRLRKDDTVMVRSGKYKGSSGKVLNVYPKLNMVTVEGINIVKRHTKPTRALPQGGIVEITKPILVSKVGVVDPSTKRPSRVGYKLDKSGAKSRVFTKSGKEIK